MAHPTVWPGKYFLYAVGNTSAMSFTRDLPPEEPATILSLGCGDIRNVLYTVFMEEKNSRRLLDFTCCDYDPGVLARNVLLLSLIHDKDVSTDIVWNIYIHIKLDMASYAVLVDQCKKMIRFSESMEAWNSSPYGRFIRIATEHTLTELRHHWELYVGMEALPQARRSAINSSFAKAMKEQASEDILIFPSARSFGPLILHAVQLCSKEFKHYWETGTTFTEEEGIKAATLLNPTFVYCRMGEGCFLHHATDPLVPFHLAPVIGNDNEPATIGSLVNAAKSEFRDWCDIFHDFLATRPTGPPIVRYALADVVAICHALRTFRATGNVETDVPMEHWSSKLIQFSKDEYVTRSAPTVFNAIDTCNLSDHVGLLNLLVSAIPLMSSSPFSVLYTESLVVNPEEDATKDFKKRLHADIPILSLLLGLCPVDYLAEFSARANTHELFVGQLMKKKYPQFHQTTVWKQLMTRDVVINHGKDQALPPTYDAAQLAAVLYNIYLSLFQREEASSLVQLGHGAVTMTVSRTNVVYYVRDSFVFLLKLVKERNKITDAEWLEVMTRFLFIQEKDTSFVPDSQARHNFYTQLFRHGLFKLFYYLKPILTEGPVFSKWDNVSPIVWIVFSIPRQKIQVLGENVEKTGNPPLHCNIVGKQSFNSFTIQRAGFGKIVVTGTKAHPKVIIEEDPLGWNGTLPLVVCFSAPAYLLVNVEPISHFKVCLSVRSTTHTVPLLGRLGVGLNLFATDLLNENHVHILPDDFTSASMVSSPAPDQSAWEASSGEQIGKPRKVVVSFDKDHKEVALLTSRFSVDNETAQTSFRSGSFPTISQVSPCVMRVLLGNLQQNVVFPFPILGSQHKLRLARKSLYMEVVVPPSTPFSPEGMNLHPFPVVEADASLNAWSLHRLNIARIPNLRIKKPDQRHWLVTHLASMMSVRQRKLRGQPDYEPFMALKESIHSIFVHCTGLQGVLMTNCFSLRDPETEDCDTILFVSDIKYDLQCHTVVADGYVLPLTMKIMPKIWDSFGPLIGGPKISQLIMHPGEMRVWKHYLPAVAERCRSNWVHRKKCEYSVQGKVPLNDEARFDPLCSCGRGENVEGMMANSLWKPFAPYVTRIALSPLFTVTYLEEVY